MCGIAGFTGDFSPELLSQMNSAVVHRGPDDEGTQYFISNDHPIGFAHRRLSIIDLSREGHQPMTVDCPCCSDKSDKLWLTYNGEIYNFPELREHLLSKGHRFHSQTDSEVILHLYTEYGLDMFKHLNGMFAFAIFDGRETGLPEGVKQGDVILARDSIGIKPLYISELPKGVLFASEIKSLLKCEDIPRDLDPSAIDAYLTYLWCPAPHTMLKAVKKVMPGETLILRDCKVHKRLKIPVEHYHVTPGISEKDYVQQLREKLKESVDRQMISDVPVGAFLSGGLDSSAIVALMRKINPDKNISCFTIAFTGGKNIDGAAEDLPYARQVAKDLNVDLHEVNVDENSISQLSKMLYYLDEPQADPAAINAMLITELAHKHDMKVLMSGAGGDDLFTGYRRHVALNYSTKFDFMPMLFCKIIAKCSRKISTGETWFSGASSDLTRRLLKVGCGFDKQGDELLENYFQWSMASQRQKLFCDSFNDSLNNSNRLSLLKCLDNVSSQTPDLQRMLHIEMQHFLADHNLNYTDKMAMANNVEVRVPLLDKVLVDFANQIPMHLKLKGTDTKYIFKEAMSDLLPQSIIRRPKTGFGAPLRYWLQNQLHGLTQEILYSEKFKNRGIFSPVEFKKLIELNANKKVDASYLIFSVLCIEMWCRLFIDGEDYSSLAV